MGYESALKAAGAIVHEFKEFGSYQGEWWAKVTYQGVTGWVSGSYGSCSGCDAFYAEFGWKDDEEPDYQERFKKFGESYLDNIKSQQEAEKLAVENSSWDLSADEMVKFIKEAA